MDLQQPKPHSAPCERNQFPIGDQLARVLKPGNLVWEIGSGTGQHAVYFGSRFPDILWQPSDRGEMHQGIQMWLDEADLSNVNELLEFDLLDSVTPVSAADVVFCANTIHIAPWEAGSRLFDHAARGLNPEGTVILYGPFRYADRELEPSNARFDEWLRSVDPARGIRLFEDVQHRANSAGFALAEDITMPANNRLLRWARTSVQ